MNGENILNIFHIGNPSDTGAWTTGDLTTAANTFNNAISAAWMENLSTAFTFLGCTATDLTSVTGAEVTVAADHSGSDAGVVLSQGSAAVLSWNIALRYRGGHPRTYVCGLTQTYIGTAKTISTSGISTLQSMAAAIVTELGSASWTRSPAPTLVCVGRIRAKVQLASPIVSPITGYQVHARLDSQRRRLGKEG
jgi:hypothetical protein